MNLIILQSEANKGRELRQNIDWTGYGFSRIETAYSQSRAEELCREVSPDLILCATSFADGCYIRLLKKIKKDHPLAQIILTGPVESRDFHDILQLGVLDYAENPVGFTSLKSILELFHTRTQYQKSVLKKAQESEYWYKNRNLVQDQFWKNLLLGRISSDPEDIEKAASQVEERIDKDRHYRMILITMKNQEEMWSRWGEHVCQSMLQNLGRAASDDLQLISRVIIIYSRIIALFTDETPEVKVTEWCNLMAERGKEDLGAALFFYMGEPAYCESFADLYHGLLTFSKDDVLRQNRILKVNRRIIDNPERITIPADWYDILNSSNPSLLVEEVRTFLVTQAKNGLLTEQRIRVFQQDILQLLFNYMERKELKAHELYDNSEIYKLYKAAILSIDGMCWWIQSCISYINDTISGKNKESGGKTVAAAKEYIRAHLDSKLPIDQIAISVHLSPDYLGKIFKKETGETIQTYITRKRMEKARSLLLNTDKPVSQICFDIGFDNPSYFIRVFKDYNGITPKKYRNNG